MTNNADKLEIARLTQELERSRRFEAVCHCGALLSEHGYSENHGAVDMREPCPNADRVKELEGYLRPVSGVTGERNWSNLGGEVAYLVNQVRSLQGTCEHLTGILEKERADFRKSEDRESVRAVTLAVHKAERVHAIQRAERLAALLRESREYLLTESTHPFYADDDEIKRIDAALAEVGVK